jgi:hypothetical protein
LQVSTKVPFVTVLDDEGRERGSLQLQLHNSEEAHQVWMRLKALENLKFLLQLRRFSSVYSNYKYKYFNASDSNSNEFKGIYS